LVIKQDTLYIVPFLVVTIPKWLHVLLKLSDQATAIEQPT